MKKYIVILTGAMLLGAGHLHAARDLTDIDSGLAVIEWSLGILSKSQDRYVREVVRDIKSKLAPYGDPAKSNTSYKARLASVEARVKYEKAALRLAQAQLRLLDATERIQGLTLAKTSRKSRRFGKGMVYARAALEKAGLAVHEWEMRVANLKAESDEREKDLVCADEESDEESEYRRRAVASMRSTCLDDVRRFTRKRSLTL